MEITTIKIVSSSELFSSLSDEIRNELYDACSFTFTFGDCHFSLIKAETASHWITNVITFEDDRVNNVLETLKTLETENVFIDLEN
jgi:hypothetical protein